MTQDDIEAIKQLKYRYLRTLDLKQWDEFTECFLPEATGDYAGLRFEDRDALVAYMREHLGDLASYKLIRGTAYDAPPAGRACRNHLATTLETCPRPD